MLGQKSNWLFGLLPAMDSTSSTSIFHMLRLIAHFTCESSRSSLTLFMNIIWNKFGRLNGSPVKSTQRTHRFHSSISLSLSLYASLPFAEVWNTDSHILTRCREKFLFEFRELLQQADAYLAIKSMPLRRQTGAYNGWDAHRSIEALLGWLKHLWFANDVEVSSMWNFHVDCHFGCCTMSSEALWVWNAPY